MKVTAYCGLCNSEFEVIPNTNPHTDIENGLTSDWLIPEHTSSSGEGLCNGGGKIPDFVSILTREKGSTY